MADDEALIKSVVSSLGIIELNSEAYLILILCSRRSRICLRKVQSLLIKSGVNIVVVSVCCGAKIEFKTKYFQVSPHLNDYNATNAKFAAKFSPEVYDEVNWFIMEQTTKSLTMLSKPKYNRSKQKYALF